MVVVGGWCWCVDRVGAGELKAIAGGISQMHGSGCFSTGASRGGFTRSLALSQGSNGIGRSRARRLDEVGSVARVFHLIAPEVGRGG